MNSIDFSIRTNHYYSTTNRFIEFNGTAGLDILFANRREASVSWTQNVVNLPFPTIIFNETGILPKGRYTFGSLQVKYLSNFLRPFSWGITIEHGGYYNGKRTTYIGSLKYRSQPWGNFGFDFTYNNISLNNINIHPYLLGPLWKLHSPMQYSGQLFCNTILKSKTSM